MFDNRVGTQVGRFLERLVEWGCSSRSNAWHANPTCVGWAPHPSARLTECREPLAAPVATHGMHHVSSLSSVSTQAFMHHPAESQLAAVAEVSNCHWSAQRRLRSNSQATAMHDVHAHAQQPQHSRRQARQAADLDPHGRGGGDAVCRSLACPIFQQRQQHQCAHVRTATQFMHLGSQEGERSTRRATNPNPVPLHESITGDYSLETPRDDNGNGNCSSVQAGSSVERSPGSSAMAHSPLQSGSAMSCCGAYMRGGGGEGMLCDSNVSTTTLGAGGHHPCSTGYFSTTGSAMTPMSSSDVASCMSAADPASRGQSFSHGSHVVSVAQQLEQAQYAARGSGDTWRSTNCCAQD